MRHLVSFIILTVVSSGAYASKTVSGVVAVSTGPMKAVTQSVDRNLTAGDDVFMNDEVETGAKTRAQVLLRDESVFSMAPSSRIVFDEFVYDPTVGEGSLQASLVKEACASCRANCQITGQKISKSKQGRQQSASVALKLWLSAASREAHLSCFRGKWKFLPIAVLSLLIARIWY